MKYVAFYAEQCEYKAFETFVEAEKWLIKMSLNDSEGYPMETIYGGDYIAKITYRSKYIETDNKDNYPEYDELSSEEQWVYDWDSIGHIVMEEVKDDS